MERLQRAFRGKRVLITGHTGFKGSWLAHWLLGMGAKVGGLSVDIPTQPANFDVLGLAGRMDHHLADIRDLAAVKRIVGDFAPDFVFHLAAQPIVSRSYADPLETLSTNIMGTANVLEALRAATSPVVGVMITSDKCYENVEWVFGYRETDALGGKDIYSASKAGAEAVFRSYQQSFFDRVDGPVRLATARAGNVIGGGDWAKDRIVADAVRAWSQGERVRIRSPHATRPWQHVLEPLSGYLALAAALAESADLHGESFNFGPRGEQNHTVLQLLTDLSRIWGHERPEDAIEQVAPPSFKESGLLKLNCDKALFHLRWHATWDYARCVRHVGEWYSAYYRGGEGLAALCDRQIAAFAADARDQALAWAE